MTKERDEVREMEEQVANILSGAFGRSVEWHLPLAGVIVKAETPTLRMAVVKKEAELPKNPYHPNPLREYSHQITEAGKVGYAEAQQDMLEDGWVKEAQR